MHSSQGQIYSQVFLHCTGALNGCVAYFATLAGKSTICLEVRVGNPPQQGLVGGGGSSGSSALSAATVLHSRIDICGIIIEDKYYYVQSERVLCICAGAKKLRNRPQESLDTVFLHGTPEGCQGERSR